MTTNKQVNKKIKEKFSDTIDRKTTPAPENKVEPTTNTPPTPEPKVEAPTEPKVETPVQGPQPKTDEQISADKQTADILAGAKEEAKQKQEQERLRKREEERKEKRDSVKSGVINEEVGFPPLIDWYKKHTSEKNEKYQQDKADKYIESGVKGDIHSTRSFKMQGGGLPELVELIGNIGVTNLKREGNKILGEENGQRVEYSINKAGEPVRNVIGEIDTEQELYAKKESIPYKATKGGIVFNPDSAGDVMGLLHRFPNAKFSNNNSEAVVVGKAINKVYGKYFQNPSVDTIIAGLKTDDLEVGSIVWQKMIKANGGELTPEMIEAEQKSKISKEIITINQDATDLENGFSDEEEETENKNKKEDEIDEDSLTVTEKEEREVIKDSTKKIIDDYKKESAKIVDRFNNFKPDPKLEEANKTMNAAAKKVRDLKEKKRNIIKDVRKKYPNLPMSAQIAMANNRIAEMSGDLISAQIELSEANANYRFYEKQNTERKDLLYKQTSLLLSLGADTAKLEVGLAETKRKEAQAIIDGNIELLKQTKMQKYILEEQQRIKDGGLKFINTTDGVQVYKGSELIGMHSNETIENLPEAIKEQVAINEAVQLSMGKTDMSKVKNKKAVEEILKKVDDFGKKNAKQLEILENVVPGAKWKALKGNKDVITAIVRGENPIKIINNKVKSAILSEKRNEELREKLNNRKALLKIEGALRKAGKMDGGTNILEAITQGILNFGGITYDEEMGTLEHKSRKYLITYLKNISGVAVSDKEAQRVGKMLFRMRDNRDRFQMKLDNLLLDNEMEIDTVLDEYFGSNEKLKKQIFYEYYPKTYNTDGLTF